MAPSRDPLASIPAKLATRLTGLILPLAILLILGMIWQMGGLVERLEQHRDRALEVTRLDASLQYLDEVLRLSAQMAVTSGNGEWERRYQKHKPLFVDQLEATADIDPTAAGTELSRGLDEAGRRLFALEAQALYLFRQDRLAEAQVLLGTSAYDEARAVFQARLEDLRHNLEFGTQRRISETEQAIQFYARGIIMLLVVSALFWLLLWWGFHQRNLFLRRNMEGRDRAEKELRRQSHILLQLAEHTPVALALLDRKFNYLIASKKWRMEYNLGDNPLVGSNLFDAYPVSEERKVRLRDTLQGIPDISDGAMVETEQGVCWYRWHNSPWYRDSGEVGGVVLFLENITRRKTVEETVRKMEEKYRLLIENMPDYILELDPSGKILFNNRPMRVDMSARDPHTIFELFPAVYGQSIRDRLAQLRATGAAPPLDLAVNVGGKEVFYRVRMPAATTQGELMKVLVICTDITKERRAVTAMYHAQGVLERRVKARTAELEVANEEVRSFAYIISHDLRAPLVNIRGFLGELRLAFDIILKHAKELEASLSGAEREQLVMAMEEDIPEAMGFIKSSVIRMDQLINAVLKLSRLGRKELHFEPVQVKALVGECLQNLAYRIEREEIEVSVGDLPDVVADETAMSQIFANILTNAATYLDPGRKPKISVGGVREEGFTRYWVTDNGRGIAEVDIPQVFEIFKRVGRHDSKGEGMGMAYVKALVTRMGGTIGCDSEPGRGTTFRFTICNQLNELRGEARP